MVKGKKSAVSALAKTDVLEEAIRIRAYELYVERGKKDGHDLEDWLHAEEELKLRTDRINAA